MKRNNKIFRTYRVGLKDDDFLHVSISSFGVGFGLLFGFFFLIFKKLHLLVLKLKNKSVTKCSRHPLETDLQQKSAFLK